MSDLPKIVNTNKSNSNAGKYVNAKSAQFVARIKGRTIRVRLVDLSNGKTLQRPSECIQDGLGIWHLPVDYKVQPGTALVV